MIRNVAQRSLKMDHRLQLYLDDFASIGPDEFCTEIITYNTGRLSEFWAILEEKEGGEPPLPFWAIAWPGGRALARFILDDPGEFSEKRILNFACGSGIEAIAAASVGAAVTAVDLDPLACEMCRLVAQKNRVTFSIECADIRSLVNRLNEFDLVMAGDVFYEPQLAETALSLMAEARAKGLDCIVSDPCRIHMPRVGFKELSRMMVPVSKTIEGVARRETIVLRKE